MEKQEQMYVLVMQLPLRGVLRSGGLVFVLKGTANSADRCVRMWCVLGVGAWRGRPWGTTCWPA